MRAKFDAFVTAALFDASGQAAFALGDGSVRFETGEAVTAHDGAILCAVAHPRGAGLLTGGDDGRLAVTTPAGSDEVAAIPGRWIEAVATSPATGLYAFGAGRDLHVRDAGDPAWARTFAHERSVADIAFEAKGRRIAVATYGGAVLWYARIADQKPVKLNWAGSHIGVAFSPDGKFLISSMQESQLHGWRLSDAKDMRMGGYPSKVKSLAFLSEGAFLATAGAPGAVLWPFSGANGPMGKAATEIGFDESALVARVATTSDDDILAAGLDDGRVWVCHVARERTETIRADKSAAICALAVSADGKRLAWGDESGAVGVDDIPF